MLFKTLERLIGLANVYIGFRVPSHTVCVLERLNNFLDILKSFIQSITWSFTQDKENAIHKFGISTQVAKQRIKLHQTNNKYATIQHYVKYTATAI